MRWGAVAALPCAIVAAVRAATLAADYAASRPLDYVRWTPPQHRWLSSRRKRKLLRAGNQIGKTWSGLAEVICAKQRNGPTGTVRLQFFDSTMRFENRAPTAAEPLTL